MGARRKRELPPEFQAPKAPVEVVSTARPIEKVEGVAYQSLRIKEPTHKLRFSAGVKLIEAKEDQTITFRKEPFPHFKVMPTGVEVPLDNIASAIPVTAALNDKLTRGGRLAERARRLEESMGVAPPAPFKAAPPKIVENAKGETVQVVPEEDDDVDDSVDEGDIDG